VRVHGYARTSWAEQARGVVPTVSEQERALRAFCEKTGLELLDVHCDTAISPSQTTMEGVVSILDAPIEEWDAVLVVSPCRIQHPTASLNFLEELRDNEKKVLLADEATARLLARLVKPAPAPAAAQERAQGDAGEQARRRDIAERLLRGREAGARAGKHQSGPAPFGYRRDYDRRDEGGGVMLVPDDSEGEVVRLIFREYLRLRSMKRLIKLLDERGLRTRRGKRWSRAGVSWILKNDTYVGRVHFGAIHVQGRHTRLVPPILFNKVQKLIRENNKRGRDDELDAADDLEEVAVGAEAEVGTASSHDDDDARCA
jgi:site-specific DNA recombinase